MIAIHPDKIDMIWSRLQGRLSKVQQGLDTPCWEFQGARDQDGYGKVRVGDEVERAHRLSFMCNHGPIEAGMVVRHKCDNPPCCNPAHLEGGTHEENMQDMVERGRHRGNAKITSDEAVAIRLAKVRGASIASLASKYGVSESTISAVTSGQNWQDSLDFLEEG